MMTFYGYFQINKRDHKTLDEEFNGSGGKRTMNRKIPSWTIVIEFESEKTIK